MPDAVHAAEARFALPQPLTVLLARKIARGDAITGEQACAGARARTPSITGIGESEAQGGRYEWYKRAR